MNSLFNHAVKQSQALRRDLDTFAASPETAPLALQGQISATLTSFSRTLDDYASTAANEIVEERKKRADVRLEKFRQELQDAKDQFRQLKLQREESQLNASRQELFGRRTHQSTDVENPYSSGNTPVNTYADTSREQGLARESDVLGRAGHQLDEFLERGRLVLGDLSDQREMLRSTQKAIYGVANTLGVSSETIRLVERRAFQDKWVFYGGVVFMVVCFYYILKWFG